MDIVTNQNNINGYLQQHQMARSTASLHSNDSEVTGIEIPPTNRLH